MEKNPTIPGENHVECLKYDGNPENKIILDSKTITMPGSRKKGNTIKSEQITKSENVFDKESKTVKQAAASPDSPAKKAISNSQPFVKSPVVAERVDSKCDICSKTYGNKNILKAHMKTHDSKDICDISSKPTVAEKRSCKQCNLGFRSVSYLAIHMKSRHDEKRLVACTTCGQNNFKNISRHEKFCRMSEDERAAYKATMKVECQKCHKVFAQKVKLDRHMNTVHSTIKLLQCEHCGHKDNRSDNMKTHIKNNHSELTQILNIKLV